MPKLVIFDCDGVLVDSEPLAAKAYVATFARHGLSITEEIIQQCVGMKQADIFARIETLTGLSFPQDRAGDLWVETRRLFGEALKPTDGIAAFLASLPTARCVASSSSMERIAFSLGVTGLDGFFEGRLFSSSMVRHGKPAPDLFLHAASRTGFDPADCVVIEDSPFGVEGARAAGMTAIGYTGGSHSHAGHAGQLLTAGADEVHADWTAIEMALRQRGFIAG